MQMHPIPRIWDQYRDSSGTSFLHTPKEPTVWNPDPFRMAVADARKWSQPIPPPPPPVVRRPVSPAISISDSDLEDSPPAKRRRRAPPPPPVKIVRNPGDFAYLVKQLDHKELQTIFGNILTSNADARRQFEEFYDAPPGCPIRPFDFDACLTTCREQLSEIGNDEWQAERYEEDREGWIDGIKEAVDSSVREIEDVCTSEATPTDGKLRGVDVLLEIALDLDKERYYLSEDWCGGGVEVELIFSRVDDALEEIFDELLSGSCEFLAGDGVAPLLEKMDKMNKWKAMSELAKRIREKQALRRDSVTRIALNSSGYEYRIASQAHVTHEGRLFLAQSMTVENSVPRSIPIS